MKNWQFAVAVVIGFVAFKLVDVTYIHPPTPKQRAEWVRKRSDAPTLKSNGGGGDRQVVS
jgi:hypothetical protein